MLKKIIYIAADNDELPIEGFLQMILDADSNIAPPSDNRYPKQFDAFNDDSDDEDDEDDEEIEELPFAPPTRQPGRHARALELKVNNFLMKNVYRYLSGLENDADAISHALTALARSGRVAQLYRAEEFSRAAGYIWRACKRAHINTFRGKKKKTLAALMTPLEESAAERTMGDFSSKDMQSAREQAGLPASPALVPAYCKLLENKDNIFLCMLPDDLLPFLLECSIADQELLLLRVFYALDAEGIGAHMSTPISAPSVYTNWFRLRRALERYMTRGA